MTNQIRVTSVSLVSVALDYLFCEKYLFEKKYLQELVVGPPSSLFLGGRATLSPSRESGEVLCSLRLSQFGILMRARHWRFRCVLSVRPSVCLSVCLFVRP